jgi:hypothetical protein
VQEYENVQLSEENLVGHKSRMRHEVALVSPSFPAQTFVSHLLQTIFAPRNAQEREGENKRERERLQTSARGRERARDSEGASDGAGKRGSKGSRERAHHTYQVPLPQKIFWGICAVGLVGVVKASFGYARTPGKTVLSL